MQILILSAPNPHKVAGVVARDMLNGFRTRGHTVRLAVNTYDRYTDRDIICLQTLTSHVFARLKKKLRHLTLQLSGSAVLTDPNFCVQTLDQTKIHIRTKTLLSKVGVKPDVIVYLFPQGFLNAANLFELNKATGAPIYWYLMDSAALTGGCHYSWDCLGYTHGCGQCPALYSSDPEDQTAINFRFKRHYLSHTDIHPVCGSTWQYKMAIASPLFNKENIHRILLPVDPNVFHPAPKSGAREKLGIPKDGLVLFFGATALGEKRKGMAYLLRALQIYRDSGPPGSEKLRLLVAGSDFESIAGKLPFPAHSLGLVLGNKDLATAFQASDCFASPSIEDAGPMMINQALMCGRPVLAFEMGVAEDLVHRGSTGYRARLKDCDDLARGLDELLRMNRETRTHYEQNCRDMALENCSPQVHITTWEALLNQQEI